MNPSNVTNIQVKCVNSAQSVASCFLLRSPANLGCMKLVSPKTSLSNNSDRQTREKRTEKHFWTHRG